MYEDRTRYLADGTGWCPNTVVWKAVVDFCGVGGWIKTDSLESVG